MDDERPMYEPIDDSLRDLAATGYNTPDGLVPREEMWARIAAARRAARATPAAPVEREERVETPIIAFPLHRHHRTLWRWSAALAAGIILGVAVDRALVGRGSSPAPQVAQHETSPASGVATPVAPQPESLAGRDVASANHPTTPASSTPTTSRGAGSARALVPAPRDVATARREPTTPDPRDLYHAAAVQTLVQAEALLTAYRRTGDVAADPQAMQQAARWARDVLSSTRLLMDSPAARDPRMRVLFTDLELVLAQIVQLSGAPLQAPERELIERALRDRDLLPRLRSAVPAGLATS
ncbi:MAG: hypothetical protein JWL95_1324 [Gemmatimonadetes bacterium]|nr:hypothetical protein [Gemmatimonadota bacterium]